MDRNHNVYIPLCIGLLASLSQKRTLQQTPSVSVTHKKLVQAMEIKEPLPASEVMGRYPSLVNIDTANAIKMSFEQLPKIRYIDTEFLLINKERTFWLTPQTNENHIILDNEKYDLKQCHLHVPAKHEINGNSNNMEMHIVHEDTRGGLAILGVLFQLGEENHILQEAFEKPYFISQNQFLLTEKINLRDLIPYKTKIFRYEEYSHPEVTRWIICQNPISLSSEQLNSFIEHFGSHIRLARLPKVQTLLYY